MSVKFPVRKAVGEILSFRVANPNRSQKAEIANVDGILNRFCPVGKLAGTKRRAREDEQEAALEQATRMESALIGAGLLSR
jgi:hypothetical protein